MMEYKVLIEEMFIYYFIAKRLINSTKLGFLGIFPSKEEKLLNELYNSSDIEEISDLTNKLFNKLDVEKTHLKINTNPYGFKNTDDLIGEAISYSSSEYKKDVLNNVKKTLKVDLSAHDKLILCIDRIGQIRRVLAGLSPDERKGLMENVTSIRGKKNVIKAVDAENVKNVTEIEVSQQEVKFSEDVKISVNLDTSVQRKEEIDEDKVSVGFAVEDLSNQELKDINKENSIEKKLEEAEEEAEVLDFEETNEINILEEVTEVVEKDNLDDSMIDEVVETSDVIDTNLETVKEDIVIEGYEENASQSNLSPISEPEIVVPEETFEVPQIFKIIERDGVSVDENL